MRLDNEYQAGATHTGQFSESRLTIGHTSPLDDITVQMAQIVESIHGHISKYTSVDELTFKGTYYSNTANHSILVHEDNKTRFAVGIMKKFLIPTDQSPSVAIPIVVYQKADKQAIESHGIYKITPVSTLAQVSLSEIAHYCPLYLFCHPNTQDLYLTLRCQPYLE